MYCILRQLIGSLGSISWDTTVTPQDSAGEVGQPLPPCRPTYPKKQRKTGDQRTIIPVFLLLRFRGKKKQQTKKHPGFRSCCVFMKKNKDNQIFPQIIFQSWCVSFITRGEGKRESGGHAISNGAVRPNPPRKPNNRKIRNEAKQNETKWAARPVSSPSSIPSHPLRKNAKTTKTTTNNHHQQRTLLLCWLPGHRFHENHARIRQITI